MWFAKIFLVCTSETSQMKAPPLSSLKYAHRKLSELKTKEMTTKKQAAAENVTSKCLMNDDLRITWDESKKSEMNEKFCLSFRLASVFDVDVEAQTNDNVKFLSFFSFCFSRFGYDDVKPKDAHTSKCQTNDIFSLALPRHQGNRNETNETIKTVDGYADGNIRRRSSSAFDGCFGVKWMAKISVWNEKCRVKRVENSTRSRTFHANAIEKWDKCDSTGRENENGRKKETTTTKMMSVFCCALSPKWN